MFADHPSGLWGRAGKYSRIVVSMYDTMRCANVVLSGPAYACYWFVFLLWNFLTMSDLPTCHNNWYFKDGSVTIQVSQLYSGFHDPFSTPEFCRPKTSCTMFTGRSYANTPNFSPWYYLFHSPGKQQSTVQVRVKPLKLLKTLPMPMEKMVVPMQRFSWFPTPHDFECLLECMFWE